MQAALVRLWHVLTLNMYSTFVQTVSPCTRLLTINRARSGFGRLAQQNIGIPVHCAGVCVNVGVSREIGAAAQGSVTSLQAHRFETKDLACWSIMLSRRVLPFFRWLHLWSCLSFTFHFQLTVLHSLLLPAAFQPFIHSVAVRSRTVQVVYRPLLLYSQAFTK